MGSAGDPWMWMLGTLIMALILAATEPILANDLSCNSPSATEPSDSNRIYGGEAGEDTRSEGTGSGSRIVKGSNCKRDSQPWQGALLLAPNKLYCGAVLVHPQWLITAAHCKKPVYRVRLGHHSMSPVYESGPQMLRGVKSIPHPGYSYPNHSNDLMLIKLNKRVRISHEIKPINISSHCPTAGTQCLVSGWGTTNSSQHNFPKQLQCISVNVLSQQKCEDAYPGQIDNSMFCAIGEGAKDSCQGDSGGPVVCNSYLQGLVSWGDFPCAQPNRPGVYTNLCHFHKWIYTTIENN